MNTHALLIVSPEQTVAALPEEVRIPGPDVHHESVDVLTIDLVRKLKQLAYEAPTHSDVRWLVLMAHEYTHTAQNALLKLLEEPPARTKIVMLANNTQQLLPTVRSRLEIVYAASTAGAELGTEEVQAWLSMSVGERLEKVVELHKKPDSKIVLSHYITTCVALVTQRHVYLDLEQKQIAADAIRWLSSSGSSKKYLLEALALSLPIAANS